MRRDDRQNELWKDPQTSEKGDLARDYKKALIALARSNTGNRHKKRNLQWSDERESHLWLISSQYMDGTVDVNELEQVELTFTSHFQRALISFASKSMKWRMFDLLFFQRGK